MVLSIKPDNGEVKQTNQIASFFRKGVKVRYNKKLTGKVKLYISEKNSFRNFSEVLSLYEHSLN